MRLFYNDVNSNRGLVEVFKPTQVETYIYDNSLSTLDIHSVHANQTWTNVLRYGRRYYLKDNTKFYSPCFFVYPENYVCPKKETSAGINLLCIIPVSFLFECFKEPGKVRNPKSWQLTFPLRFRANKDKTWYTFYFTREKHVSPSSKRAVSQRA